MSISAVSSGSSYTDLPSNRNSIQQDFKQLSQALQSNDLAGAQQSFSDLQKLLSSSPKSSPSSIQSDFSNVGKALASGDLQGAQSAFAQLQTDVQTASQSAQTQRGGHHHHNHGPETASSTQSATDQSAVNTNGSVSLLG